MLQPGEIPEDGKQQYPFLNSSFQIDICFVKIYVISQSISCLEDIEVLDENGDLETNNDSGLYTPVQMSVLQAKPVDPGT